MAAERTPPEFTPLTRGRTAEDQADLEHLRRLTGLAAGVTALFVAFFAAGAIAWGSARMGGLAALLAAVALLLLAGRFAGSGSERWTVGLSVAAMLCLPLLAVPLMPGSWAADMLAAQLAAFVAIRFLRGRLLALTLVLCVVALVYSSILGLVLPLAPVPRWFQRTVAASAAFTASIFAIWLVGRLSATLRKSLVQAHEARRRANFLARAGERLTRQIDPAQVLDELAHLVVPEIADWCTAVLGGVGSASRRVAAIHRDPERSALAEEYLRRFPPGEHRTSQMTDALAEGRPIWTVEVSDATLQAAAQSPEHLDLMRRLGTASAGILPLVARGRVLGILSVMRGDPARRFGPEDVALVQALVARAAVALDNARLLWESRRQEERRGFLAEAGLRLGQSLDPEPTLTTLAQLAVPRLADWCLVDVIEDDELRRVAVAHADPEKARWADALRGALNPDRKEGRPVLEEALRTGRSILWREVTPAEIDRAVADPGLRAAVAEMGIRSSMTVAMQTRGRTIGVLTFLSTRPDRRFDDDDLALAEELALRGAMAVDNARLFREAQRAIGMREDVLAVVSHDLNNILQPILSASGLLVRRLPEDGRASPAHQARLIERSAGRMARIIRDLLDAASLDTGKLSLQRGEHDAGAIAREAAELFEPAAAAKGLAFERRLPDGPLPLQCDRGRLAQVLANLLSNAVKFTEHGAIRLALAGRDGECLFEVADTGPGIPADQRRNVFDRYWRGRPAQAPGAGLGLYIAKGIVEAHGGRIWVEGADGEGAVFKFALPLSR